uniref:Secreted protein n=1 Tax=Romanomermis culicivorax TaxID=13658 RepID=A0A915IQE8_ROMCU
MIPPTTAIIHAIRPPFVSMVMMILPTLMATTMTVTVRTTAIAAPTTTNLDQCPILAIIAATD